MEIDIDFSAIERKPGTPYSTAHCAIGRILYPEPSGIPGKESSPEIGYLIYIKASLTGDEPSDVREYAGNNREFPHQSTGDQWFSESQFESYRRLGQHIGHAVFSGAARSGHTLAAPDQFFKQVRNCWPQPTRVRAETFEKHAREWTDLLKDIGADDELCHIDTLFLPGQGTHPPRKAAYSAARVIEFMQCVYDDLDLENHWNLPQHRLWIQRFRRWKSSESLTRTWDSTQENFSDRFKSFYNRL